MPQSSSQTAEEAQARWKAVCNVFAHASSPEEARPLLQRMKEEFADRMEGRPDTDVLYATLTIMRWEAMSMLHFLITECQLDPRACLETPDRKGSDPVYFHALVKGHEGAVIFLLDKGAGPHATDSHEKTNSIKKLRITTCLIY